MVKRSYRLEEIVAKLRQVDVLHRQGQRMTIADAVRDIGVSEVMFYRWHEHHGGINAVQMKHIKELVARARKESRRISHTSFSVERPLSAARRHSLYVTSSSRLPKVMLAIVTPPCFTSKG